MVTILAFIAVLGVVVLVHELGHFTAAKLAGVRVLEFGVGFPPRLLGIRRGETLYSINALPFGGFVRMPGEDDPTEPGSVAGRSPLVRLIILVAGSAMNGLLPVVLFTIFFLLPRGVPVTDVVILGVADGSPAAQANVLPGDVVREIDGREVNNSADLRTGVQLRLGAESSWLVERGGRLTEVRLVPRVKPPEGEGSVGVLLTDARVSVTAVQTRSSAGQAGLRPGDLLLHIGDARILFVDGSPASPPEAIAAARAETPDAEVPILVLRGGDLVELSLPTTAAHLSGMELAVYPEVRRSKPIWRAVPASMTQMWDVLVMFRNEVSRWVQGVRPDPVGPIGIAQFTGEAARGGINTLLFWTALLSMNVGIVNLLPIPALDGGRIAFVLLELARGGRRVSPEKERVVHVAGFALLIAVLVYVSIADIQRLLD